jgi:glutamate racemase
LELLVLACNTASTVALPKLRTSFTVPVVGVVPAIKPAASLTRTRTIGLLATPGTVQRPYIDELIQAHAADCRVLRAGSRRLVELAEKKLRGAAVPPAEVAAELAPLFNASPAGASRLDTVVLGCTHFPLLLDELAAAAPWPVQWLDASAGVAARTAYLLREQGRDAAAPRSGTPRPVAYMTALDPEAAALERALAAMGIEGPEAL